MASENNQIVSDSRRHVQVLLRVLRIWTWKRQGTTVCTLLVSVIWLEKSSSGVGAQARVPL